MLLCLQSKHLFILAKFIIIGDKVGQGESLSDLGKYQCFDFRKEVIAFSNAFFFYLGPAVQF